MIQIHGNNDDLGFAWIAMIPSILQAMQSMSQPSPAAGGTATPAATGGGFDIAKIVQGLFHPGGDNQPAPGAVAPPPSAANLTPEQVQQIVNATLAARGVTGARPTIPGVPGQCQPGDAFSSKYNLCYNPNIYANEEAAHLAVQRGLSPETGMRAGGFPGSGGMTPSAGGRARGGRGGRTRSRRSRRGMRGLYGVSLNGAAASVGAASGKWGKIFLVAGTALLGVGAAWGYSRAS
jgi:hypothetical protein